MEPVDGEFPIVLPNSLRELAVLVIRPESTARQVSRRHFTHGDIQSVGTARVSEVDQVHPSARVTPPSASGRALGSAAATDMN